MTSGRVSRLAQRVRAPVDADEHGLEVPDVAADDPQVVLVPRAAGDHEDMAVAEPRLERRELDALREQPALLAQVAHRVVGEAPRSPPPGAPAARPAHAAARARSSTLPVARRSPFRKMEPPRTVTHSPSVSCSKSGAPGASTSRTPPRRSVSGPRFGYLPLDDGETLTTTRTPDSTSSSAETRSRSAWSMIATSSR